MPDPFTPAFNSIALNATTNGYQHISISLPVALQGKAVTLEFRLTAPQPISGADRVRLDNISIAVSQPLEAGAIGISEDTGTAARLLAIAQGVWVGLINVPVSSTDFGLGLGTTACTHTNQSERAISTPAETNGSTGFGQGGFNNQHAFANPDFIDELALRAEQIANLIVPATDQFWADRDTPASADSHAIEPQLNASLATEIQHEAIRKVGSEQAVESEIGNNGTLVNGSSIIGVSNLDLGFYAAPPGSNGSVSNLQVFDLQKFAFLPLQSRADFIEIPDLEWPHIFPILDIAAGLGQNKDQQDQDSLQHNPSFGGLTLAPDRNLVNSTVIWENDLGSGMTIDLFMVSRGGKPYELGPRPDMRVGFSSFLLCT